MHPTLAFPGHPKDPGTLALPLLPINPDPDQWRSMRRTGLGASEMAVVLRRSPFMSPYALYHSKLGGYDIPSTEDMDIGTASEPMITDMFRAEYPMFYVDKSAAGLWGHPRHEWMMCTPDRIALDPSTSEIAPVELKTSQTAEGWGATGSDVVPLHYRIQAVIQAGILGARRSFIARLGTRVKGHRFSVYVIDFDDQEFMSYVDEGYLFMDRIKQRAEPPMDAHPATLKALESVYSNVDKDAIAMVDPIVASAWIHARAERARWKEMVAKWDNELRRALGNCGKGMTPDGDVFVSRTIGKRDGYTVEPTTVDTLRRVGKRGYSTEDGRVQAADETEDAHAETTAASGQESGA